MCTESVILSTHLILCYFCLLLSSVITSIGVFSNESVLRNSQTKHWSFGFSISPSNEYSVLISFRIEWFALSAVQETLKSLLQHHSCKVSILQLSTFFMVQHSHPYMTTGKTIALTRQTFVSKVMSVLFNVLFRSVTAFLPRSKCLLISWLQSSSAVILEPKKIKSLTVSIFSPSICLEVMGPDAMILVFWMLNNPGFSLSSFTLTKRLLERTRCQRGGWMWSTFLSADISEIYNETQKYMQKRIYRTTKNLSRTKELGRKTRMLVGLDLPLASGGTETLFWSTLGQLSESE